MTKDCTGFALNLADAKKNLGEPAPETYNRRALWKNRSSR